MKIAIVGGTRFIGHAAATRAVECGHDVVVDSSAIRSALGWRAITSPRERVEDLVAWLRRSRTTG